MKRNTLIAALVAAAATLALSGAAIAKNGHGHGNGGGSNGGNVPITQPKPTIHPSQAVKDAIYCSLHCGHIEEDNGIEAGG